LALSYENVYVDRLQKRLSESIVPEVKDKLNRHLVQTREQQEHLKERIKMLGGEPITETAYTRASPITKIHYRNP
jgi:ferritin-like metal-binding protein YciE